jgi:hypothetical protein
LAASTSKRCGAEEGASAACCGGAGVCSAATCLEASAHADDLWLRACCALLERAAPHARPGSLLLQARTCFGL